MTSCVLTGAADTTSRSGRFEALDVMSQDTNVDEDMTTEDNVAKLSTA